MNWTRGLTRLWSVFAVLWVVAVPIVVATALAREHAKQAVFWEETAVRTASDQVYQPDTREKLANAYAEYGRKERAQAAVVPQLKLLFTGDQLLPAVGVLAGPPLAILVIVWLLSGSTKWVVAGFKGDHAVNSHRAEHDAGVE